MSSVERGISHMNLDDDEDYLFNQQSQPGPVLMPYYKNHGLCSSQQLVKFLCDQKTLHSRKKNKNNELEKKL